MGLNVFCVYWGNKYSVAYVHALKMMVSEYLTVPHDFICISSQKINNITTINPVVFFAGWWQKIGLFAPGIAKKPSIYFDLDVVITGNIDYLVKYTDRFSAPANWAQSGHGGVQSSVMAWPGSWNTPFYLFNYERDKIKFYGDQEYLTSILNDAWQKIPGVGSYKYHCKSNVPENIKIICFHGKPDPHEVDDRWILPYTLTLAMYIKQDKLNC